MIVLAVTIALLFALYNLLEGYGKYQRVSFAHAIEIADDYCGLEKDSYSEWKQIPVAHDEGHRSIGFGPEFVDVVRKEIRSDESLREKIAGEFGLDKNVEEDELSSKASEYMLWNFFKTFQIGVHSDMLNIELASADNSPFGSSGLTTEVLHVVESGHSGLFPNNETVKKALKRINLSGVGNWHSVSDIIDYLGQIKGEMKFTFMTWLDKCSRWELIHVEPTSIPKMLEHLVNAVWNANTEFFYGHRLSTVSSLAVDYRNLELWRGGHVLSFYNDEFESGTEQDSIVLSVLLPKSSGAFAIEIIIAVTIVVWTMFAIGVFWFCSWLWSRPLKKLVDASMKAGAALESKNMIEDLQSIADADELQQRGSATEEFRSLLKTLANLLREREEWLGMHIHNVKNDLLAISLILQKHQNSGDSAISSIDEISSIVQRVRNRVAGYQPLLEKSEAKTLVDLGSMIHSVVDDIEDVGGKAVFKAQSQNYVLGDRTVLKSAVENLVWNAHHHGGSIEIEANTICKGEKILIVIDDDGPGIPDEKLKELLKLYQRDENLAGIEGEGLKISTRIILDHRGMIFFENRKTEEGDVDGFRVCVVLPEAEN